MTRVDFYVINSDNSEAQQHFACRLAAKALKQGHRVLIATRDAAHSQALDSLLWHFRPESFVPHCCEGQAEAGEAPVLISHSAEAGGHHDLLINLAGGIPPHFSRFQRLAEIVIQDNTSLNNSRANYSYYKQRGYPVNTHQTNG